VIAEALAAEGEPEAGPAPRLEAAPQSAPPPQPQPAPSPVPQPGAATAADESVLLELRGLSKTYRMREGLLGRREVPAVREVSLRLRRGRTLGLVGESGSGKTTVGLSLLRLQSIDAGQALIEGTDLFSLDERAWAPWRRRLQIVFQNPYASLNPRFTAAQTLLEPMRLHGIGDSQADRLAQARALLARVGLPADAMGRYPHEFSGGQRQRIAIARALAVRPDLIVCDEPVSALDVSVQAQVLNLLRDLQQRDGLTYLFISHDLAVVRYLADEVAVMKDGRVVECADSETLYREPAHPYTRALLAAVPRGRRIG
jgi:peptide/nickel transport system ATP-binding protein